MTDELPTEAEEFLGWMASERGRSANTLAAYRRDLSGYAGWLAGLVPTAEVEVWDGDGHYPHLVEPDRFLARLAAFDAAL